jgi:hypothetical protein
MPKQNDHPSTPVPAGYAINPASSRPSKEEIAALAHALWTARGCPDGSPNADWFRAEELLRSKDRIAESLAA